jgi:hypothetical protein
VDSPRPLPATSGPPAALAACLLVSLALVATLPACRQRVSLQQVDRTNCTQEVTDAFGPQAATLVAVQATDGGPLFRPHVLESLDRICQAFEDEMTDDLVAVKCVTNLPIMEGRPAGTRVVVARDEFPLSADDALWFQRLVLQLEFARGDVVDTGGGRVGFVHLPHASFEDVDLGAIFAAQEEAEGATLQMAMDEGLPEQRERYRAIAGDGPSSRYLVGLFDSGEDGGMKEPAALQALDRFQAAAESLPKVSQTFAITDDLKLVRRGLRKGNPGEALIPPKRSEVAQLLLALSMSPAGSAFGPRLDTAERVALVRINLAAVPREVENRLGRRLDQLLVHETRPGGRAFLCLE